MKTIKLCLLICTLTLISDTVVAQDIDKLHSTYKSKAEIYKANVEGPGFCVADDTMSFAAAGKKFFVLYWECSSGMYSTTIVMFASSVAYKEEEWSLWYTGHAYQGRVRGVVDDKNQQITFMSEKGKRLLNLSLEDPE